MKENLDLDEGEIHGKVVEYLVIISIVVMCSLAMIYWNYL